MQNFIFHDKKTLTRKNVPKLIKDDSKLVYVVSQANQSIDTLNGCVIICHGLGDNKDGRNNMFLNLAENLCESGLKVYRFDFKGHDESKLGKNKKQTVTGLVRDLKTMLQIVKKENPNLDIAIIGHSIGGGVASYVAGKYPSKIKELIRLAPVSNFADAFTGSDLATAISVNAYTRNNPAENIPTKHALKILRKSKRFVEGINVKALQVEEQREIKEYSKIVKFKNRIIRECKLYNPQRWLKNVNFPIHTFVASHDNVILTKDNEEYYEPNKLSTHELFDDDHFFSKNFEHITQIISERLTNTFSKSIYKDNSRI